MCFTCREPGSGPAPVCNRQTPPPHACSGDRSYAGIAGCESSRAQRIGRAIGGRRQVGVRCPDSVWSLRGSPARSAASKIQGGAGAIRATPCLVGSDLGRPGRCLPAPRRAASSGGVEFQLLEPVRWELGPDSMKGQCREQTHDSPWCSVTGWSGRRERATPSHQLHRRLAVCGRSHVASPRRRPVHGEPRDAPCLLPAVATPSDLTTDGHRPILIHGGACDPVRGVSAYATEAACCSFACDPTSTKPARSEAHNPALPGLLRAFRHEPRTQSLRRAARSVPSNRRTPASRA